ncbi:hypothetical protein AnaeK_2012 [Anaeromyxobacter sp. K]|uniref:hypothetical protein n=1 Tax=Anaeromyxobacter sp. (strain K) TaxID=447217 RepID=UPI00017BE266|nr:hypothetical protein [Anaeromyxobacter sp. K]ACG73240.1 hypothetical protein AnaeK_2012 [Anaeromyxobacter sp. K]
MKTGKQRLPEVLGTLARVPHVKKGLKLAAYRMRPEQIAALRREALKRAAAREVGKPDASELVREAVDLWLAKKAAK